MIRWKVSVARKRVIREKNKVEYTSVFAKKKAAFETHLLSNASPAMNPGSSTYTNSGFGIIGRS